MNMGNRELNVNYIGALVEKNGRYEYSEFTIDQPQDVIDRIQTMAESSSYSSNDIWSYFHDTIKRDVKGSISYCYPENYYASFVDKVLYPSKPEDKNKSIYRCQQDYENEDLSKKNLAKRIIRWINASNYLMKHKSLRENSDIKVLSTERIGFSEFNYVVNDDIKVRVYTNFCFGRSAYLFVNITYKGVNILPYTAIIKFRYANMVSFINHSANFAAVRGSWKKVFDYLVELSNCAKEDSDKFYQKYIVDEVVGMVEGLEKIVADPKSSLASVAQEFKNKSFFDNTRCIHVWNMTNNDYNDYCIYKDESVMAYLAEKVSNAMALIANLKTLEPFFNDVSKYIERIKVIANNIIPQIEDFIPTVLKDEQRLTNEYEKLRSIHDARYAKLKPLLKVKKQLDCIADSKLREKKLNTFNRRHPDYEEQYTMYKMVCEEMNVIAYERDKRQSFVDKMRSCIDNIKNVLATE